jgi:hypothetical protein
MGPPLDKLPLPKGWIRTFSNSQQRYYYSHSETKHTQWHFPTASEANDPWMAKRRAETNHSSSRNARNAGPQHQQQQQQQRQAKKPRLEAPSSTSTLTSTLPSTSTLTSTSFLDVADTTSVAIIVPFRDLHSEQKRSEHLSKFVPHMIEFLGNLQHKEKTISDFHIYIVEQSDDQRKFNRGKLLNIGFDLARKRKTKRGDSTANHNTNTANTANTASTKHDVFVFHDVDLLPSTQLNEAYARFPTVPHHIARCWDRYSNNPKYFGGIVSFSSSDYKRINGYPNTFWGW